VSYNTLFSINEYSLNGPYVKSQYIFSLSNYRKEWYNLRDRTKTPHENGKDISKESFIQYGISYSKLHANLLLEEIFEELEKVLNTKDDIEWNGSTIKLLSIVGYLIKTGHINPTTVVPYKILFLGVIDEPVQKILALKSEVFDVQFGIGAQAIHNNLRASIESTIINKTPEIIISDMDQSEATNINDVINIVLEHLEIILNVADVCIYKIMYMTPEVMNAIMDVYKDVKFQSVIFLDLVSSGPYSLEGYILIQKGTSVTCSASALDLWFSNKQVFSKKPTIDTSLYKTIKLTDILSYKRAINSNDYFSYCFSVNQENYINGLSIASSLSNDYVVMPFGTQKAFEMIIYGYKSLNRIKLIRRIRGRIGKINITQGGDEYPLSGPKNNPNFPLRIYNGSRLVESQMYNLSCKIAIGEKINKMIDLYKGSIRIIDIGGRNMEMLSVISEEWKYTVMDKHSLPSFIDKYDVTHIKKYCDWSTLEEFDDYNIIIAMFVVMADGVDAEEQKRRINFLKQLSNRGKTVFFNYYSPTRGSIIASFHHRSITYSADFQQGTFTGYRELPDLINLSGTEFPNFDRMYVSTGEVLKAQMYFGTSVNSELLCFLKNFNDFCPFGMFNGVSS